jgi:hypothetical protein
LTHYDAHICGNLDAQLQRINANKLDVAKAQAWREYAESASRP